MAYREHANGKVTHSQGYRSVHGKGVTFASDQELALARRGTLITLIGKEEYLKWFEETFESDGKSVDDFSWEVILEKMNTKINEVRA